MRFAVSFALVAAISVLAPTPSAHACGGFFCNAVTQTVIVQAGERVLFAPHDGLVTMHVEIIYQGDPTEFGWILPLSEMPMDAAGRPLPLDEAVEVSSQRLFTLLQSQTDPTFILNQDPDDDTFCAVATAADSGTAQDAAPGSDGGSPGVTVLEEAEVGPYNAQLIEADSSSALFEWLGENGYLQDQKALPILDDYLSRGFKFLGIKLQSGKDTGDLRPLAVTLGEGAPCVPLVLTQIAASPDMPILVWVLGDARAIPKNFIHAVIDERAFGWPGAPNYQSQLVEALTEAGRRAWVTEFSGPVDPLRGSLLRPGASTARLEEATTLQGVLQALSELGISPGDEDLDATIRSNVTPPEGLMGYPFGNCQYCQFCDWAEEMCAQDGMANDEHATTAAEFYNFINYWADQEASGAIDLMIDAAALARAIEDEIITPRRNIETLFAGASTLTRFFTMIDPEDMTRDPIFSFNPDLPPVSNVHTATYDLDDCSSNTAEITYSDGTKAVMDCGGSCSFGFPQIGPMPGTKPLLYPEVLDEEGEPIRISLDQVDEVDTILDSAEVGVPTLPPTFQAESPEVTVPPGSDTTTRDDGGCAGGGAGALALLMGLGLILRTRLQGGCCSRRRF